MRRIVSSPSSLRAIALGLVAFAGLVGVHGCTYVTNTTAVQCTSEAECLSLGPEFAGTTCDRTTKTCIRVPEDDGLCSHNSECIDKAGGIPAICRKRDRKCVTLQTPECPTVMAQPGQLINDDAIIIGALTPAGHTQLGDIMEKALELSQADFSKQVRGLPALDDSGNTRPLVIVACHEFGAEGYTGLVRAGEHLAKDIGVPINIGPVDPANGAYVLGQVMNPNRVLSILPLGTSTNLFKVANPIAPTPITWATTMSDETIATATGLLITKEIEPKLRASGVTGPIRVAMLVEDNAFGLTTADLVQGKLNFNNTDAAGNASASPPNYLRLNIGDLNDAVGNPSPEAKIAAAIGATLGFKPHVVIHSYGPGAIGKTFFPLAFGWPQGLPHAYHIDVVGTFGLFDPLFEIIDTVHLQGKVISEVAHQPDKSRVSQWTIKYRSEYPQFRDSPLPDFPNIQAWYDSAYLAAYAIVANGKKPLTGENVAQTLPLLLPPGQPIFTGTEDINKALGLLKSGSGIDLNGLAGNMDIDPRTGRPNYDLDFTCPETDAVTKKTTRFKYSGVSLLNNIATGTLACD